MGSVCGNREPYHGPTFRTAGRLNVEAKARSVPGGRSGEDGERLLLRCLISSLASTRIGRRWVAGAGGDEVFDFVEGLDAAAGAYGGAVEGGGGAGEIELAVSGQS